MFWIVSGAGTEVALRFALLLALARLLGPNAFGVIGAAIAVVNISQVISQMGIGSALIQRPILELRHIEAAFVFSLLIGAIVSSTIFLFAPMITAFFSIDGLTPVLRVLSLMPLLGNLGAVAEGLTRRALAFRRLAVISLLSFFFGFGVTGLGLAIAGAGLWALVAAYLVQAALFSIMLVCTQPHTKAPRIESAALRDLLIFGTGLTAWQLGAALALSGDNIVVGRALGAEALGLYGRAFQLISVPVT